MRRRIYNRARKHYPREGSHGWEHIKQVLRAAKRYTGRPLTPEEYAAIVYHDSSLMSGERDTHHLDSADILRKDLGKLMDPASLRRSYKAIQEHRASYQGRFSTPVSELLSSADRGDPDVRHALRRAMQYRLEQGADRHTALRDAITHIKNKHGRDGYKRLPNLYVEHNQDKINQMYDDIDNMENLPHDEVEDMLYGGYGE